MQSTAARTGTSHAANIREIRLVRAYVRFPLHLWTRPLVEAMVYNFHRIPEPCVAGSTSAGESVDQNQIGDRGVPNRYARPSRCRAAIMTRC